MSTWYDTWFESPWYPKLYQHRSSEEAKEAVMLVDTVAGIPKGSRILDLACGYGRHAYALAANGYLVVGIDSSSSLIDRAQDRFDELARESRVKWRREVVEIRVQPVA